MAPTVLGYAATLLAAAEWTLRRRGDADIYLDLSAAHDFTRKVVSPDHVVLSAVIPFGNRGRQQGCVLDVTGRILPNGDRYKGLDMQVKVNNLNLPREDGYFEAYMFKKSDRLELGLDIVVRGEGAARRIDELGRMKVELHHSFYMRSPLQYRRVEWDFVTARATAAPSSNGNGKKSEAGEAGGKAAKTATKTRTRTEPARQVGVALPVRTHILTPDDDFLQVVEQYAVPLSKKGDIVAVAESALAIIQGRLYHIENLRPRWLARKLCRMFDADSSLSTPYGCEMAFEVCGTGRILAAMAAGIAGKVIGRAGDFYRVAGPDVATIDDASGTLAPFDKHVVLGPAQSKQVCDEVKRRFGLEAAVVDANDLKKVMIVAISDPSLSQTVVDSLIDNPQGNAGEQTPIVVIPRSD
jgi:hypothetical protein